MPAVIGTSAAIVLLTFVSVLGQSEIHPGPKALLEVDTMRGLAELLFGSFLLPFEAASILLLAAAVAVMVLAKRQRATTAKDLETADNMSGEREGA